MVHLLNCVWPHIFEQSPPVINACLDAVDGFMVSLGPNVLLMYVVQGLFHPARRVREVYWRVYNNLYIYASHALVATYPRVEDTEENTYTIGQLDVFV